MHVFMHCQIWKLIQTVAKRFCKILYRKRWLKQSLAGKNIQKILHHCTHTNFIKQLYTLLHISILSCVIGSVYIHTGIHSSTLYTVFTTLTCVIDSDVLQTIIHSSTLYTVNYTAKVYSRSPGPPFLHCILVKL